MGRHYEFYVLIKAAAVFSSCFALDTCANDTTISECCLCSQVTECNATCPDGFKIVNISSFNCSKDDTNEPTTHSPAIGSSEVRLTKVCVFVAQKRVDEKFPVVVVVVPACVLVISIVIAVLIIKYCIKKRRVKTREHIYDEPDEIYEPVEINCPQQNESSRVPCSHTKKHVVLTDASGQKETFEVVSFEETDPQTVKRSENSKITTANFRPGVTILSYKKVKDVKGGIESSTASSAIQALKTTSGNDGDLAPNETNIAKANLEPYETVYLDGKENGSKKERENHSVNINEQGCVPSNGAREKNTVQTNEERNKANLEAYDLVSFNDKSNKRSNEANIPSEKAETTTDQLVDYDIIEFDKNPKAKK